ncbi:polysaccharide biosynthesis/export family protein [Gloeobacter kilaueensis]|uniref:Polysaccharide export protein n=1 Tax=Gloeobacter kilaueensis (strain ATCC BAA-2537 / CCAP 1431/1 / ULC 316 / JS1) TaxID=1183438 RepID=U5QG11_GLOK1|nr:polysaccharide biosynthesis/export family protein [Gloeobacter kilaueensis]AGY57851.1 polysaccharide export protein [Gloeobacter kilaueensis JS1]
MQMVISRLRISLAVLVLGLVLSEQCPAQVLSPTVAAQKTFSVQASTTSYTLGPGDGLQIIYFNVPEMSGSRTVLPDGTLSLPLIGSVRVTDMTAEELSERLSELYRPYLTKSRIAVTVERPRPITITVSGEVNRPGPYTTQPVQAVVATGSTSIGTIPTVITNRVNVSSAITQAGGLTEQADVRNVTLIRRLPGGQVVRQTLDLWALIQRGDVQQNPVLQDGDALVVEKAAVVNPEEYGYIANSNLSPDTINVQVVGEVIKPGQVQLNGSAPLTVALQAAGGLTNLADPNRVELLRVNRNGTVLHKIIDAKVERPIDQDKNPPLRNNDMIIVRRSFGGEIISGLNTALGPLGQIGNVLLLFRALR